MREVDINSFCSGEPNPRANLKRPRVDEGVALSVINTNSTQGKIQYLQGKAKTGWEHRMGRKGITKSDMSRTTTSDGHFGRLFPVMRIGKIREKSSRGLKGQKQKF